MSGLRPIAAVTTDTFLDATGTEVNQLRDPDARCRSVTSYERGFRLSKPALLGCNYSRSGFENAATNLTRSA
jgi:hypothetical protein